MIDITLYENKLPHPQLRRQKFPEPKRVDYENYTQLGVAMDEWERNITIYDKQRPQLIDGYNKETQRLNELFMYDLLDEMDWLRLQDSKQMAISAYLWEQGDGSKRSIQDIAYDVSDMIDELIKG